MQGVGAVGGYKEGLIPRAVALLHHLIETSQHKGSVVVTQSGKHTTYQTTSTLVCLRLIRCNQPYEAWLSMLCSRFHESCVNKHATVCTSKQRLSMTPCLAQVTASNRQAQP